MPKDMQKRKMMFLDFDVYRNEIDGLLSIMHALIHFSGITYFRQTQSQVDTLKIFLINGQEMKLGLD